MRVEGGCHCGEIRYRAVVDPERVEICHCSDCQTLSGAAYRTVAIARQADFELTRGKLKKYAKTAADGSIRVQTFCPNCGTPICSTPPEGSQGGIGIRVGSIDQRDELNPRHQYWYRSAQNWTQDLTGIARTETE